MEIIQQYKSFWDACDELKSAKIIIADSKISKVLKSIVACPPLLEIVGEALVGYNFANELSKCTSNLTQNGSKITLPSEPYRVIAFVFSLLSEFDSKHMDLQEFISQYYPQESLTDSFALFNQNLMEPFRDYLCEWVGFKERKEETDTEQSSSEEKLEEIPTDTPQEQKDETQIFFDDVEMILNQIKETINLDSKIKKDRLDELNITINALLETIKIKNFKIFNALLISLNNLITPVKSVRFYNMELQNRIAKFYSLV